MTIHCVKALGNKMLPASDDDSEEFLHHPTGTKYECQVMAHRNYMFHKKFHSLVRLAFDRWEPENKEFKGIKVGKNYDRFRKDLVIATGRYDLAVNLKGEVRAEAKSISFKKMKEDEFQKLYSDVIDVLLVSILADTNKDELIALVDEIVGYV